MRIQVRKMKPPPASGLLFKLVMVSMVCIFSAICLCYSVIPGSPTHDVERRQINPTRTYSVAIGTQMKVLPSWYIREGDTVEINCFTNHDLGNNRGKMDLQLVWTSLDTKTKKVLMSQRASIGIFYVLGPVTHEHQGLYTCRGDGSLPDVYVLTWHYFIWVADPSPTASIDVISHNRSQFANREEFTIGCQLPNDNNQWKMMRFDSWVGTITECPNQVTSDRSLSCTSRSASPWSDNLYWCESPAGHRTNALNVTPTDMLVVLETPTVPVWEGDNVTLRCLYRNRTTKKFTTKFRMVFYKDDRQKFVTNGASVTLPTVTKADEGLYKCRHPKEGLSPTSWIGVKAHPDVDQKSDVLHQTPAPTL
ncbi:uncharacterized protein [Antennarius striatus]|uniref:uncharacterized protein isoform X2 n=1 Tax=Antennarius striatus TaxID=241820 RepID=UPI0035AF705B